MCVGLVGAMSMDQEKIGVHEVKSLPRASVSERGRVTGESPKTGLLRVRTVPGDDRAQSAAKVAGGWRGEEKATRA